MAKKKSRDSRMSKGGRQKAHIAQEKKRQEKFAQKRADGRAYEYKKNPYKKGTKKYRHERLDRAEKSQSKRLPYARLKSVFAKMAPVKPEEYDRKGN